MRVWQASTGVALAIAASLAAFIVLRPVPAPRVAVLAPLIRRRAGACGDRRARRRVERAAERGDRGAERHDLELWALAAGETRPHSLGVLPAAGRRLIAALPPGTQLLVSLEPRGGSPTGQPTGPVLYGGRLTEVD